MENTIRPTKKQRELLEFIAAFIDEHGYSPSYREIMTGCSYNSVATVAVHVKNLINRGHLVKRDHSARSLEVVNAAETLLASPQISKSSETREEKWLVKIVESRFEDYEQSPSNEKSDDLFVLVGALKVLGYDAAARSFMPRLPKS